MGASAGSSGVSRRPWLRPEAPEARDSRSTRTTRIPCSASSRAQAHPTTPPPTTTTSVPRTGPEPTHQNPQRGNAAPFTARFARGGPAPLWKVAGLGLQVVDRGRDRSEVAALVRED